MEIVLLVIGIALIVYAFYKWSASNFNYFEKIGLPYYEKPTFMNGIMVRMIFSRFSTDQFCLKLFEKFPEAKIFGLFDYRTPFFCIRDPEVLKQLTIKDFDHFENHVPFIDAKSDVLFGNSLLAMSGSKWREMRAALSPAFTSSKMKQMFELVTETAFEMSNYFKDESAGGKVHNCDMKDIFSKYTNDVIASAAFGITVNSLKDDKNEFYVTGKSILQLTNPITIIKFILIGIMPAVMRWLGIPLFSKKIMQFFRSMVVVNMKIRETENIFRPDMINILMQLKKGTLKHSTKNDVQDEQSFATVEESTIGKKTINRDWTEDELVAQCLIFFLAGFDTSSQLLTFVSYELAINKDVQEKLYREVVETNRKCTGKFVTYDLLQNMKYLDQVISETLRKWPPTAMSDRLCAKDYNYNDGTHKFTIKKGQFCWIPIVAFHRSAAYFPNPEKFDPERFNDENKGDIVSGSYIPFGIGPRNCIGSRFALMEVKAIIYYLVLHFTFEPNEKTQIPLKLKKSPGTLIPEKPVHLQLKAR